MMPKSLSWGEKVTEIYVAEYDKRVSKKGTEFYDGKCTIDGQRFFFFCFDKNLVENGVPPVTITCNYERTERDNKVKLSNVKLPAGALKGYVAEARKLDNEAGLEKKLADLEARLKNLEMVVADIELGRSTKRGAAQATQNGLV